MMRYLLLALLTATVCLFSDCSNRQAAKPNTFEALDSAHIASDTAMQVDMDLSYEYQRTLVQNDSVVYDFLAYDKPKGQAGKEWESKFHIIRRTAHAEDTVAKGNRSNPVQAVWLSDLDRDGRAEIMFYEYPKAAGRLVDLIAWEMPPGAKARKIEVALQEVPQHYRGRDTFFVYQDRLIRRFPYYEKQGDSAATGSDWQSYRLDHGRLVLDKERMQQ
jgi:hypothetical protein